MIPYETIRRKRDGEPLSRAEILAFFQGFERGDVADYQVAALLMAICLRGLGPDELAALVEAMLESGSRVTFDDVGARPVDKHSTGGVGDKVSLVLAPLVSALGVPVPMMSGRGLGHTGGTLDKLESIPGFRTDLDLDRFRRQVETVGCALIGQTAEIAPLDKRLYGLRDVTATVESIPLIASSIMSKKIAEGISGLVLDVKVGSGAFLPERADAERLAATMIRIGESHGRDVVAVLTAMDRPLGHAVGNALEMEEAIEALVGRGPADLRTVTLALAAEMLVLGGVERDVATAQEHAAAALDDGRALEQMRRIIEAQGGNAAVLDDPAILPQAPVERVVEASADGVVASIDTRAIGAASVALGAGRATLDSRIDPAVGMLLTAKPGQEVGRGEPIATVLAATREAAAAGAAAVGGAIRIADRAERAPLPLIVDRIPERELPA
ncbi:MAG: thymidine phosphorylase [Longimicrobiales bacterium]